MNLPPGFDSVFLGDRVAKTRDQGVRAWETKAKNIFSGFRLTKVVSAPGIEGFKLANEFAVKAAKGIRHWEDMDV